MFDIPKGINFLKLGVFSVVVYCVCVQYVCFILNHIFFAVGRPRNYSSKMDSCSCKWMWSENNWLYSKVCYFIFLLLWNSEYFDLSYLVFMFVSWDSTSFVCYNHEVVLSVFVAVSNFSLIWPQAHFNFIFTGSGLGHEVILCTDFQVCVGQ